VDQATSGDVIKVATGLYADVNSHGGSAQVAYLDKSITIRGGYTTYNWSVPDPEANPTTLDAQQQGRVLYVARDIAPTIEGLRITGGDAGAERGGGVYIRNGMITLIKNTVFGNTAKDGGGVYIGYSDAMLEGNALTSNIADEIGGGLYLDCSSATLEGGLIISNTAGRLGGGVSVSFGNPCSTFSGVTIASNHANVGGGLFLEFCSSTLTNTVIADNHASKTGGGLYIAGCSPNLLHGTIARNGAGDGSGLVVRDTEYIGYQIFSIADLTNTILVSHTVGITVAEGNTARLEATLWGTDTWANGTDWAGDGTVSTGTINVRRDPAFVNPEAGEYSIGPGSGAIDAGLDVGVRHDLYGEPRPIGLGYDIGTDEAGVIVSKEASPDSVLSGVPLTFSLRVTNASNVDLHATITDILPAPMTTTPPLVWTPLIPAGGGVWAQPIVVTVEQGYAGSLTNLMEVTSQEGARGADHATVSVLDRIYLPLVLRNRP
jgi:hypothetical protein